MVKDRNRERQIKALQTAVTLLQGRVALLERKAYGPSIEHMAYPYQTEESLRHIGEGSW